MALRWRRHVDRLGAQGLVEIYDDDPQPLATVGYTIVARLLAELLRRAFDQHLDEHRCPERGGFGYCDEAMRLFRLLPADDQIVVA